MILLETTNLNQGFDLELWIKILTDFVALLTLVKAIYEYVKAQKWKKAEFLAKEVKEFYANVDVQNALLMLDWNEIEIEIPIGEQDSFVFNDKMFKSALIPHQIKEDFTSEETKIRLTFDEFLFKFGMFQNYVDSGLIKSEDLRPYFNYFIDLMGDLSQNRKHADCLKQLWIYIVFYNFIPVIKLLKSFGYDIKESRD